MSSQLLAGTTAAMVPVRPNRHCTTTTLSASPPPAEPARDSARSASWTGAEPEAWAAA